MLAVILEYAQKWQTLMAAIVALFAAKRAYAAAMAKVEFDRDVAIQTLISKKLGMFLRLKHALIVLNFRLTEAVKAIPEKPIAIDGASVTIKRGRIMFMIPPEVLEAWSAIDLFPSSIVFELAILKASVPHVESFAEGLDQQVWTVNALTPLGDELKEYREVCAKLLEAVEKIIDELDRAVDRFREHKMFA